MNPDYEKLLDDIARSLYAQSNGQGMDYPTFYGELARLVDVKTGAPLRVRSALAAGRNTADKLQILKQFYPTASAATITPQRGQQNADEFQRRHPRIAAVLGVRPKQTQVLMYFDPERGPVLVDEEGFSLKDLVDVAPYVAEGIGGAAGAALGSEGGPAGIAVGSGAGAAVARDFTGRALRAVSGSEDVRSEGRQATDLLTDFGVNALGDVAGRAVGHVAATGASEVASRVLGTRAGKEAGEAAARTGVPLTLGQATGSPGMQSLEMTARSIPGGMGVVEDFVTAQERGLINLSDEIGQALRSGGPPASNAEANAMIARSLQGVVDRFNTTREAMELAVERAMPQGGDTMVPIRHVQAALSDLRAQYQGGDELMKQNAGDLLKWLSPLEEMAAQNNGSLPFRLLRRTRTNINQALRPADASGLAKGNLDLAASILKQDLGDAAAMGGEEASKAWRGLNEFIRQSRDDINNPISIQALTKVLQRNSDKAALDFALSGSSQGSRMLSALRQQFSPEEWSVIASSVWDNLGKTRVDGSWTAATFLRNFSKLDPTAKRVLWSGGQYAQVAPMIEDLVTLAGIRQGSQRFVNHSGTARTLMTSLLFGGGAAAASGSVGGAMAGAAIPVGMSYAAAKAFTNPAFVQALTTGVRVLNRSPNALSAVLGRIAATVQSDPEVADWYSKAVSNLANK